MREPRETLVSVDLDFFNFNTVTFLRELIAHAANVCKIKRVRLLTDHIPSLAYPKLKAKKNYEIWNYDEHDDMGNGSEEEIGTWARVWQKAGAKVVWIANTEHHVECSSYRADKTLFVEDSDIPFPESAFTGLAFFISPGYLLPRRVPRVYWELWSSLAFHDMIVNGKRVSSWTFGEIYALMHKTNGC